MRISGVEVIQGVIRVPSFGAITGDLELAGAIPAGVATIDDQMAVYVETVTSYAERAHVSLIGGLGFLRTAVPAQNFRNATGSQVLSAILGGETRSHRTDPAVLATLLPFLSVRAGTVGEQLTSLANALEVDWRTLADSTIWFGTGQPLGVGGAEETLLDWKPQYGEAIYTADSLWCVPGQDLSVGTAGRVVYDIGRQIRATVWTE